MSYHLLNPVDSNSSSPAIPLAANAHESAGVSYSLRARNVRVNNHRRNSRRTISHGVPVVTRLTPETGSDSVFLSFKIAETNLFAAHRNTCHPSLIPLDVANACAAGNICAFDPSINRIDAMGDRAKIDAPVIQAVTVPMVDNPATRGRDDNIVHVNGLLFALHHKRPRSIEGLCFGTPPRKPRVLIQLLEVGLIDKGELALSERDTAVWGKAGQPAKNITEAIA